MAVLRLIGLTLKKLLGGALLGLLKKAKVKKDDGKAT
jgi:hypothetical protein